MEPEAVEMDRKSSPPPGATGGDRELISRFQAGDRAAFNPLVTKYQEQVFNMCCRFLGNYEEAGDASQEVFLRAFRALGAFRQEAAFSTWIHTITMNTLRNVVASAPYREARKLRRLDAMPVGEEASGEGGRGGTWEPDSGEKTPLEKLGGEERERLIAGAIASLPEDHREMVVLRDVEGLSYEEIARVTGIGLGTVKSRLARARGELRERLKGSL